MKLNIFMLFTNKIIGGIIYKNKTLFFYQLKTDIEL